MPQGVVRVIVMPASPRVERRRYVTKRDLAKNVYIDECQACSWQQSMHNAKILDDRCRKMMKLASVAQYRIDIAETVK